MKKIPIPFRRRLKWFRLYELQYIVLVISLFVTILLIVYCYD